jgi:3-isopropylmalate/(R)-2-methylmalate dehydratase small subunit
MSTLVRGRIYVVGDNIDTDQIIPAQHLSLLPTIPEEYVKLGSYALSGLPEAAYPVRYVATGKVQSEFPIVVAGRNFGCGSSREHAPIALGAAGCCAVVAESFARIYFRNCVATGELYPVETMTRLCDQLRTGDEAELDLDANTLRVVGRAGVFGLRPVGEARPVIEAGGIFEFARRSGMIKT